MEQSDNPIIETFNEITNIDEHVLFLSDLVNKYSWDSNEKKVLDNQLSLIQRKKEDKCLNLSVIGEFASGKSSFINALLKEELLVSSALQGTTVVNTIIVYSDSPQLQIKYCDNSCKDYHYKNVEQLREKISIVTTDSEVARKIAYVIVGIQSEVLKHNIRIIDTPGTNAIESWHEDVTRRALHEISDLSIILTDATKPLPKTLLCFMEENLSSIYSQCAVAVTRFDLVEERERIEILDYIRKKLSSEFDIDDMLVFPFVGPAITGEMRGKSIVDDQKKMAILSEKSSIKFLKHMTRMRRLAQIKKLLALVENTLDLLNQNISRKKNTSVAELELLVKSRQAELEPFVKEQKLKKEQAFMLAYRNMRVDFISCCDRKISESKNRIYDKIRNIPGSTIETVKQSIDRELPEDCLNEAKSISNSIQPFYLKQKQIFQQIEQDFQVMFEKFFKRLKILEIKFNMEHSVPDMVKVEVSDMKEAVAYLESKISNQNWAIGGGALAGLTIGSAILPGVGTVIGGLVGLFVGGVISPDAAAVKEDFIKKIEMPLNSFFSTIKQNTLDAIDKTAELTCSALKQEIDLYLTFYKEEVDRRVKRNEEQQKTIKNEIKKMTDDMKLIETHKNQLIKALSIINHKQ